MNPTPLALIDLSLEATDPVAAHLMRFARDVAYRHRRNDADVRRFRLALDGYYRAFRIGNDAAAPVLGRGLVRALVAEYRRAHAELHPVKTLDRDAA